MVTRARPPAWIPLPRAWPARVKTAVLHAAALAHVTLTHVRGWSDHSSLRHVRDAGSIASLRSQLAQAHEECRILRARVASIPPRERPHYPPPERLAILALRASAGWTLVETARRFAVTAVTIASWMGRLEEQGERALVASRVPVNRFPEFVRVIVAALRVTAPMLGKVRIAQILGRAGLVLASSTVGRMRKKTSPPTGGVRVEKEKTVGRRAPSGRVVTARYPDHVWHVDLTLLPTSAGFWVPWWPLALLQRWPFCFWLGVVLDHFSRSVVGWRLFLKEPTALDVVGLLERARATAGTAPRHIISDQGVQFGQTYRAWCKLRRVRPRFGAVGQSGSIAVIERFFRSIKEEMLRRLVLRPLSLARMRGEVAAYVEWYDEHRPHQGLGGKTPAEVRRGVARRRAVEVRPRYPLGRGKARRARCEGALGLVVTSVKRRDHLPIVALEQAA